MFCHGNFSNTNKFFTIFKFILRGTRSINKKYLYAYSRQLCCCRDSRNIWIVCHFRRWLYSGITKVKTGAFVNKRHIFLAWTIGNSRTPGCHGDCSEFYSCGTTFYRIFDWCLNDRIFFHNWYYWWMEFISIQKLKLSDKAFAAKRKKLCPLKSKVQLYIPIQKLI